eukprot:TRINITY_DN36071_c0_g1_i1.p1 TRINITY_DN36071_c0_g1~~TRINITY_DN36071_c0_g1_i1.p1  ORF type:complete len:176 (-),score=56.86 TRINITY_DN36071_c0_g1_i1:32-559(-)
MLTKILVIAAVLFGLGFSIPSIPDQFVCTYTVFEADKTQGLPVDLFFNSSIGVAYQDAHNNGHHFADEKTNYHTTHYGCEAKAHEWTLTSLINHIDRFSYDGPGVFEFDTVDMYSMDMHDKDQDDYIVAFFKGDLFLGFRVAEMSRGRMRDYVLQFLKAEPVPDSTWDEFRKKCL